MKWQRRKHSARRRLPGITRNELPEGKPVSGRNCSHALRFGSLRAILAVAFMCVCAAVSSRAGSVVHEWGTFTALQDESGEAIGGINTDDEPVPAFVHNIASELLLTKTEAPPVFYEKGIRACHPDVTMRLETPVIYFYPDPDAGDSANVHVEFRGGWLTQYFPNAVASAPGIQDRSFSTLTNKTIGSLTWDNVKLNVSGDVPATDAHVWLTPRQVRAATIEANGEREKYLFYRGVGHIDAPLRVVRAEQELVVSRNSGAAISNNGIRSLWLVDVRSDGTAAFRVLKPDAQANVFLVKTPADFEPHEYSAGWIGRLRPGLQHELVSAGLFPDEAVALLETWSESYFKSTGLRLFFVLPQAWTDSQLPLTVSPTAQITRVMVGRIEIVTPKQRVLLAKITAGHDPGVVKDFVNRAMQVARTEDWRDLIDGKKQLAAIGFKVPEFYQNYLDLGRFRNALILDEERRRPTPQLGQFIEEFRLNPYKGSAGNLTSKSPN
jgi:hypothetical protein